MTLTFRSLALTGALALLTASTMEASQFTVNPTRIELSGRATSALVAVRNDGTAPIRLQLKTHAWAQTPEGQMTLSPTDDVVVFPTMVTLAPGEERKIRVAVTATVSDVERTYRVFLEELPAAPTDATGAAVQMLTRVGIPVFLQAATPASRAGLSQVGLEKGTLHFQIDNLGNTHIIPSQIRVRAFSATGQPVTDKSADGWYILGRTTRRYDLVFGSEDCDRIRSLLIEVEVGNTPLKGRLETPVGTCTS